MTRFEPIAIVGQGCVLPGALSPDALWRAVAGNACLITPPARGAFGLTDAEQAALPYVSGFVSGFETVFDARRARLAGLDTARLDPVCQWPLHAALEAWDEAGRVTAPSDRRGVFLANLSYPSRAKSAYAADIWTSGQSCRPATDAFNSGFPAQVLAQAIGATGPVFALDAACASSLYALEVACRKLQARQIDIGLVGAVNAADNLILHIGFQALQALSPSGRSRPFIKGADGLVPAEGAVAVVLKRLGDVTPQDRVHGVIRAIGLSNDGKRKGLLAPDSEGQAEAMRRAYDDAGLGPDSVDFLECHATGTPVGDSVEIAAATGIFGTDRRLPIGSLKANTGHLITAAGLASLLKLTQAMANETLPSMPLNGDLIDAVKSTGLQPLARPANWAAGNTPRRAAISNFGFGGNNAHLILDQYRPLKGAVQVAHTPPEPDTVVICSASLMGGSDQGERDVLRRLMNHPVSPARPAETIGTDPRHARTPPNDLLQAEAQQLAVLWLARSALNGITRPDPERSGVFVGMGCAADSARWLLRERVAKRFALTPGTPEHAIAQDAIAPPLQAATVLGAMANMTANRITSAEDLRAQGFAISSEGVSSLAALDVACDALRAGRLDMAIVAAADFATEPVAAAALAELGTLHPGDTAAALVLKRRADAEAAGDPILACLDQVQWGHASKACALFANAYGLAPAASPLFELAASALLMSRGQVITDECAIPNLTGARPGHTVTACANGLSQGASVHLTGLPARPSPDPLRPPPCLYWAAGATRASLAKKLRARKTGGKGKCRIALTATDQTALADLIGACAGTLERGAEPFGDHVYFGEGAPEGELAFVFTGSAAVYARMSRGLFMAFPELGKALASMSRAPEMAGLLTHAGLSEYEQLCAGTLVSQAHAILLRDIIGISPTAAIGLSLGETNALFAFGFWNDPGKLLDEIDEAAMYERHLGGDFETAHAAWGPNVPTDWANWHIKAPLAKLRAAMASYPNVEITIIYSQQDCLIGGPAAACRAVAEALGPGSGAAMNQHLIVHARAMKPFEDTWRKLHTRPVASVPGIRLYANAINASYAPTRARVADMLTRQAVDTVDFPATIGQAYEDGVRTFVEVGPRATLSRAISSVLGDKPHVAVATDRIIASDLGQIAHLAATLFADGRGLDIACVADRLDAARSNPWTGTHPLPLNKPVHYRTPQTPQVPATDGMPPAPHLPHPHYARANPGPVPCAPRTQPALATPRRSTPALKSVDGNTPLLARRPSGPNWDRQAIEESTRGLMSRFFGPAFLGQDAFDRQVRLPAPPLLLVDRITGIDAEAGVESTGSIWTETDLKAGDWHVHKGRIRPGPLIECGQADLTLIGWMGAGLKSRNERVYRLLGCEITFHDGGLPGPGDTLAFQIEITGHATLAGVRMFFFQYDCMVAGRKVFSVRNGQAGFFTDDELATGKGVIWDAATEAPPTRSPHPFDTSRASAKRAFSAPDVAAFRAGDGLACFGKGFEFCAAHSRPAHLPDDKLGFFDEITHFDPAGGPWGRGYLRARAHVPTNAWFYQGHFHKDPCMPGTLMAEAAVQALEFYAGAAGLTLERDGYVFEPMPGETARFVCRGQVIPDRDHEVTYEVFIDDILEGESPVLYASLLARCDGRKVFHCPRFAIRLRKDWPAPHTSDTPLRVGPMSESRGDHAALLNCAASAPSAAFGDLYLPFDAAGRAPRLPQPPYHMMTRVTHVSTRPGVKETGARVVAEYDIPAEAWYFRDNANGNMPFAVLSEIMLQPCGWLASHCGFALEGGERFRNLDGAGQVFMQVGPHDGMITVDTTLSSFSKVGPMTIVAFDVQATLGDARPVMSLKTQFGFFPAAALVRQAGLPTKETHRALLEMAPNRAGTALPKAPTAGGALAMLDRIDYFDAMGGAAGLGLARARQIVDPHAWYFKAHFFQDPVQPGSLGLDALVQILSYTACLKGDANGMANPQFETLAAGAPVKWTYRGQVTPDKQEVTTVMEIMHQVQSGDRLLVTGKGTLWCDGLRIYEASPLTIALSDRA